MTDYRYALDGAALFDLSSTGKLEVAGKDAPAFLHNLCTNDVINLPLGGGCEAYFCDARAKVLAHTFIYHVLSAGNHAFWLDVTPTPGYAGKLFAHLDKHLISEAVELTDQTDHFVQLHLAGPRAKAVLEATLGETVPDLAEFQHMERTVGLTATCHVRRRDPLGVPGYDIVCRTERAGGVRGMLVAAGASPAGAEAFELLRVEAGTPVYGIDIGEDRFVMEVPRALRAVSYSKGCYLGQEPIVMSRDRAGFVNRAFLGVKVLEGGPLAPGTKLFRDTTEVGLVTSSIVSPRLGAPLSIGYIRRGHQDVGLRLVGDGRPVEVLGFPPVGT
jgi:tRNA-modifying protein YgfZ